MRRLGKQTAEISLALAPPNAKRSSRSTETPPGIQAAGPRNLRSPQAGRGTSASRTEAAERDLISILSQRFARWALGRRVDGRYSGWTGVPS